jgi:hypothetical protein
MFQRLNPVFESDTSEEFEVDLNHQDTDPSGEDSGVNSTQTTPLKPVRRPSWLLCHTTNTEETEEVKNDVTVV